MALSACEATDLNGNYKTSPSKLRVFLRQLLSAERLNIRASQLALGEEGQNCIDQRLVADARGGVHRILAATPETKREYNGRN